ncbi:MaoC/PaaZ C-terminal domain-containing protein [Actinomyces sp. ZJ308]|uniref:MaoC/PaaZ C-terminal domain-containing protein n=1 Tax=Actinomyces sp. ZJ308 TaxID=2708342 RepID=UPI001FBB7466|nr:MaoC/PaaZ C-terminal domain-containing protein [Actinomyces sp. ZJ308]
MNGSSPLDDLVERLAAVLSGILATGSSAPSGPPELTGMEAGRLARRGAAAVLPAVLAMQQVQERVRSRGTAAAWDGLLHRRCLMEPIPSRVDGAEPSSGAGGCTDGPVLHRNSRAGWELLRATSEVETGGQCWRVTHELARRAPAPQVTAARAGKLTESGAGFDPPPSARFYRLTRGDIATWAEATGDGNPIHLLAGRAAEVGLRAGPDDVVAHGLLLGALSLALDQSSPDRRISLKFIGSADVPASPRGGAAPWATLAADPDGVVVSKGRRIVLRRGR